MIIPEAPGDTTLQRWCQGITPKLANGKAPFCILQSSNKLFCQNIKVADAIVVLADGMTKKAAERPGPSGQLGRHARRYPW